MMWALQPVHTTKSLLPCTEKMFMMCQRTGLPAVSTIGFALNSVSSRVRVPRPAAGWTASMSRRRLRHRVTYLHSRRPDDGLFTAAGVGRRKTTGGDTVSQDVDAHEVVVRGRPVLHHCERLRPGRAPK